MESAVTKERKTHHNAKGPDDIRIAVVEDDIMFRHAMEYNLKKIPGNRVFGFDTGEDCIRNYHRIEPEIMILDYRLSDRSGALRMNGLELLQEVKSFCPETEVLFISGQDNMDVTAAVMKGGAAGYIAKDFRAMDSLLEQIRQISLEVRLRKEDLKAATNGVKFSVVLLVYFMLAYMAGYGWNSINATIILSAMIVGISVLLITRGVRKSRIRNHFRPAENKRDEIWFD